MRDEHTVLLDISPYGSLSFHEKKTRELLKSALRHMDRIVGYPTSW